MYKMSVADLKKLELVHQKPNEHKMAFTLIV